VKQQEMILVEVLNDSLKHCKVGILVKGLVEISPADVVQALEAGNDLSVVAVGYTLGKKDNAISSNIENAIKWRNAPEKAGKVVAFVKSESNKLHSLREFDVVTERMLSERLVSDRESTKDGNAPTRRFWAALKNSVALFSFGRLAEFVEQIENRANSPSAIPDNLWRLGLLRDASILSAKSNPEERLKLNRKMITDIGQLSEDNRRRLTQSLSKVEASKKQDYQDAYRKLQEFFKYGKLETLEGLDFDTVQKLLSAAKEKLAVGSGGDSDVGRNGGEASVYPKKINPKERDEIIADAVVSPTEDGNESLKELAGRLEKRFENQVDEENDEDKPISGKFDDRPVELGAFDSPLRKLVGAFCTEENWGGVMTTEEAVLRDAVASCVTAEKVFFTPRSGQSPVSFDGTPVFTLLERFDGLFKEKRMDTVDVFKSIVEKLIENRKKLLVGMDFVMFFPVLGFGGFSKDGKLRDALFGYVDAWMALLQAYCRNNAAMHEVSPQGARAVARALLALDVLYIQTSNEWKGILSPLHPLYLWRFYEVFKSLEHRDSWGDEDAERLKRVLIALPQVLNFLVVDSQITGNTAAVELPCSGSCEMLPTFENKTNRYLGSDGVEAVKDVLSRWLAFAPYSAGELRLCTVDAPDHVSILRNLGEFFRRKDPCGKIVYSIFLTRGQNGNREIAQLDYDKKDCEIGEWIRLGRLQVNIRNVRNLTVVKDELKMRPVHVAFYFDQSDYGIEYGPVNRQLYITPLVVTYDYEYDILRQRGEIFPSSDSESGMVGDYHRLMRFSGMVSADRTPRPTYRPDADTRGVTSVVSDGLTQWLVAADRTMSNYMPEETLPIGEKRWGRRMVGIWASKSSRVIGQYETLLRKYNLYPDKEILRSVFTEFGHISSDGLVSIPQSGGDANANESRRKGLVGTVFAAKWFTQRHPGSLVASLDTPDARLWLHNIPVDGGRTGNQRADLIGLCYDETVDLLRITPIEVKTRDESPDAKIEVSASSECPVLKGHAADQIATVIRLLQEIFANQNVDTGTPDMFVAARREVLKLQIVSECFRELHDHDWQQKWDRLFKRLFGKDAGNALQVELRGMLLHIKLGSLGKGNETECWYEKDTDCKIDFIELTSDDIQTAIFGANASPPPTIDFDETMPDGQSEIAADDIRVDDVDIAKTNSESDERGTVETVAIELPYPVSATQNDSEDIFRLIRDFKRSCSERGIQIEECQAERAVVGPGVIRFPFKLFRGQKRQTVSNHLEDIGREMRRSGILIQVIPNSDELYLDVPRLHRDKVLFSDIIDKLPEVSSPERLPFALGRTPDGRGLIKDLSECPHLLVGGSTGSGKTVFLWTLLISLIKTHPSEKSLQILLSSSGLEDFTHFENLPHLFGGKIYSDVIETTEQITGVVFKEFERRKEILIKAREENIQRYNETHKDKLSPLVVIIDEFADLTDHLGTKKEKEAFFTPIRQIAQIGRKRGIHLVLCTQRPAADLVPTNIKAQLNARLALRVNDYQSSKMILDDTGAQHLQKHGDMLFKDMAEMERAQGYFVSATEIENLLTTVALTARLTTGAT
jgi:hypothetical protein